MPKTTKTMMSMMNWMMKRSALQISTNTARSLQGTNSLLMKRRKIRMMKMKTSQVVSTKRVYRINILTMSQLHHSSSNMTTKSRILPRSSSTKKWYNTIAIAYQAGEEWVFQMPRLQLSLLGTAS